MARPKRVEGQKTAYERMEEAFWAMLAEMPYHEMTGKEVRGRAGVSHNTFYYHFNSMDDMAQKMFDRLAIADAPRAILGIVNAGRPLIEATANIPDFQVRYERMRLLAGSGSPLLVGLLRKSIITAWLEAVEIDEADLTDADHMDLTFAFGGFIAILGSNFSASPDDMAQFSQREIGHGVFAKIQHLAQRDTQ